MTGCPYLQTLSKACCSSYSEDKEDSTNRHPCLKLDQQETIQVLDNVVIQFGKTRVSTTPNQDMKEICNCFSTWFKNNNKTFMWDTDLKKAFAGDVNVPFQSATSTNCKIDVSSRLFNSFKEFISSPSGFIKSDDSSEEMLNIHSKVIEDLKSCWKKRHQFRPFPDTISWIITLLKEWKIPFKNLFENHGIENPDSCKEGHLSPGVLVNPKIFVGFKKRDVNAHFRNCIMTALHSITLFKTTTATCILGDEQYVYIIKLDYKKSLKKTLLSMFKFSMYNNWNHQCSLYLHLYKLFNDCLPGTCSVNTIFEDPPKSSLDGSSQNSNVDHQDNATKPSTCSEPLSTPDNSNPSSEAQSPKFQAIKQRTEEILRTISSQHISNP